MFAPSCRPSAFPLSSCTGRTIATRNIEEGRFLASNISPAPVSSKSRAWIISRGWTQDRDAVMDEIEEFLTGERAGAASQTASSQRCFSPTSSAATEAGGRARRSAPGSTSCAQHHALVRKELARFRGREVNTVGRRLHRHLRRPGAGGALRLQDSRWRSSARPRDSRRSAHRRDRAAERRHRRHRGAHRSASRGGGAAERGAGLEHGERSGRGGGDCFRRSGRAAIEGRAGRAAALRQIR